MDIKKFIKCFSNKWHINNQCPECGHILTLPTKNFVDCYLDYGVRGSEELTKACKEFQDAENKLWQLIHEIGFEFLEED